LHKSTSRRARVPAIKYRSSRTRSRYQTTSFSSQVASTPASKPTVLGSFPPAGPNCSCVPKKTLDSQNEVPA
jgi:hypothetical protein